MHYRMGSSQCIFTRNLIGQFPRPVRNKTIRDKKYRLLLRELKEKRLASGMKPRVKRYKHTLVSIRKYNKERQLGRSAKDKEEMTDHYIRHTCLRMKIADAPIGLIEAKREVLKLHRLIRKVG